MKYTEAERQILIALELIGRRKPADMEALDKNKKQMFDKELVDWGDSLQRLIDRGEVIEKEGVYSPAEHIRNEVCRITLEWSSRGFDDWIIASDKSRAYSTYCKRLYGQDLCQCSMVDMDQMAHMIDALKLNPKSRVLELGCGIGRIAEHVSDVTGANIVGIDIAAKTIARARERTVAKRDRLDFQVESMDELDTSRKGVNCIIAIDSLYFVSDLKGTLSACRDIVGSGGQMGLFFSQMIGSDESTDMLLPGGTLLARALDELGLGYETREFTDEERRFWSRSRELAEELKSEFEQEGSLELYESRVKESSTIIEAVETNRVARYFYHVTVG